jgi:transposase
MEGRGLKADSTDLRRRVVTACGARDGTREQIPARFSVSVAWIRKPIRQRRETGSIEPKPRRGGRAPAFDGEAARLLREAVRADDDATLAELARAAGVACCALAVHRALARSGIARKRSRGGRPSRTAPS